MRLVKKTLLLSHRYVGIAISVMMVVWFVSGIVMMYAGGMPRISPDERFERLPAVDLSKVKISPAEAAETAVGDRVARAALLTVQGRPAYRIGAHTVFADSGEELAPISLEESKAVASEFMEVPTERIHFEGTLDEDFDQWTMLQSSQLPLHKFSVDDEAGTELYVRPRTAEVVMRTTSRTRLLAWMGTIPHWLYFAALRENQPLWYKLLVGTSALACVLAVLGLVLGATLFRRPKPFRLSAAIPYKGLPRWHYITGMVFGCFTLTWAFSGMLSMEPFEWTLAEGLTFPTDVINGGLADLEQFPAMQPAVWSNILQGSEIKQVSFTRVNDELFFDVQHAASEPLEEKKRERLHQPYYIIGAANKNRVLVSASTLEIRKEPIPVDTVVAKLLASVPEEKVAERELLTHYDSYYYSRGGLTPLPVVRVKFADPAETWVYVDPEMGNVLSTIPRTARIERWLYNGLHSLDFPFWYDKRPLWDIGMLTLLFGGLASSMFGLILAVKRVARAASQIPVQDVAPVPVVFEKEHAK